MEKDAFFRKFKVEKEFEDSDLEWSVLENIYDDYISRRKSSRIITARFKSGLWQKRYMGNLTIRSSIRTGKIINSWFVTQLPFPSCWALWMS